jgi:orotidine-5'-phosphate decarboxylase
MQKQNLSPLIVALDVPTDVEALKIVDQLSSQVDLFKVGLQLFTKEGPQIIDEIIRRGKRVFVDLKLHDIPNTVASAIESLIRPGIAFVTVHGLGGRDMLASAAGALTELRNRDPAITSKILCVTVLTSLDDDDLNEVGIDHSAAGEVLNLARLSSGCGIEGVVASPEEVSLIRQQLGNDLVIVTPGVRMENDDIGDQKRVSTPSRAIGDGANFVVMGRSLLSQRSPADAAKKVLESLQSSATQREPL